MAITRESATLSAGSENNVCTLSMPATRPDGDLYIAIICKDDDNLLTAPGGWNTIINSAGTAGFTASAFVGWRFGSSEPATYSFTHAGATEDWNGAVIRYSGAKPTTPFGSQTITPGTSSGGGGVSATFPVITAETATSKILRIFLGDSFAATGYSTGSGTFVTVNTNSGANMATVGFAEESSPGASTNTPACIFATNGADDNACITLELLAAGAGTITGSGTPTSQAATVSGTAERTVTGSGTPTAQASTVAGSAERSITGAGTPTAQAATVAGTGVVATVTYGSGTLQAQDATVAGTAERGVTGSGTPLPQESTVSGTAERTVTGSGTPTAQASTVAGGGVVDSDGSFTGIGALQAQDATVAGTAERTVTGSGTPTSQAATVAGSAERAITGSGILAAQASTVSGTAAILVYGSGVLVAQASTVSGTGQVDSAATPVVITNAGDEVYVDGEAVTILGSGFATQGAGGVTISPTDDINDPGVVVQPVSSWHSTSIQITADQGAFTLGQPVFLFVENSYGTSNLAGYPVQFQTASAGGDAGGIGFIVGIEFIRHIL